MAFEAALADAIADIDRVTTYTTPEQVIIAL
jgi:hypothetical protein